MSDTSESTSSSTSVASDSYKGWKKYESDAGFSVMVPSKWKVDQWPGGMSVYNPANQFALFGGETVRLDQQILVESGNVKNMTASVENPEQGSCGRKAKARVGSYEGFVQTCTFSLDGSMQRHFFVQGDGVVFHFVSRMDDKKLNPTFAKVRDSFRIEADTVR